METNQNKADIAQAATSTSSPKKVWVKPDLELVNVLSSGYTPTGPENQPTFFGLSFYYS